MGAKRNHGGRTLNQVRLLRKNIFHLSDTYDPKDRFETLCHVVADISTSPCTSKIGRGGKMCYSRRLDVVLLVGLTELKAQIRWTDSRTVSSHG